MAARLRVVTPDATPEEIAAIVAAIGALRTAPAVEVTDPGVHEWVHVARLRARRTGLQRGPWRLSGRVERRPPP
jgi:hypothetical protein